MIGWEFLEFHELADLFPMLVEDELSDLADQIERDGYDPLHPVVLFEGKILDGRNRWMACDCLRREGRLAEPPPFREFSGESPLAFVLRENLHRRHLTATEKTILAVEILPWEEKEALARQGARTDIGAKLPESSQGRSRDKAAEKVGVSSRYVADAKRIKKEAPDLYEEMRAGESDLQAAKKKLKRRSRPQLAPARAIPEGRFTVIYADPPWKYDHMRVDAWAVENTYPTMTLPELLAMREKIDALATDETVLFLWTTSTKLDWGVEVLEGWGFEFKSTMVWIKHRNSAGMGYWARIGHELLLIGARPKASPPPPERRFPSVIEATKGEHSEKPDEMRCIIERMFPEAKRLELFARGEAPEGWAFWGNEAR